MKMIAAGTSLFLLSGCAHLFGPSDGLVYVIGSTPSQTPCELTLAPVGATSGSGVRAVSGAFREQFMVGYSRAGHLAQLTCDGTVVSSRTFKYGRDVHFGGELPVVASAP